MMQRKLIIEEFRHADTPAGLGHAGREADFYFMLKITFVA